MKRHFMPIQAFSFTDMGHNTEQSALWTLNTLNPRIFPTRIQLFKPIYAEQDFITQFFEQFAIRISYENNAVLKEALEDEVELSPFAEQYLAQGKSGYLFDACYFDSLIVICEPSITPQQAATNYMYLFADQFALMDASEVHDSISGTELVSPFYKDIALEFLNHVSSISENENNLVTHCSEQENLGYVDLEMLLNQKENNYV